MKIQGDLTMSIGKESTHIEVRDRNANTTFLRIEIDPNQLSALLSKQGNVKCELDIRGLDSIGKNHEHETFEFILPKWFERTYDYDLVDEQDKLLMEYANRLLTDGWEADSYFGSRDSFFKKDGENWARVTIRRGV